MKKTYAAPSLVASGDAVRATQVAGPGVEGPTGIPTSAGSVGFYL
jgi:hypothetical protein